MSKIPDRTAELQELIGKFGQQVQTASTIDFRSDDAVLDRARKYVDKMDAAVSGDGGHSKTFAVACVLVKGFELSSSDALDVLREYNQRCDPPWSERELQHKIDDATRAKGASGYLRNAKPDRWEQINVPQYAEPRQRNQEPQKELPPVKIKTLRDCAEEAIEEAQKEAAGLIDVGFPELNHALGGGIAQGEFVIVAARPSQGKSAMALQMIHRITSNGIPCAFMSEEMNTKSIGQRTMQFAQSLPVNDWKGNDQVLKRNMELHFSRRAECYVIEASRTVERVCEQVRALVKEKGVKVVAIDYVQLLTNTKASRYEIVTATSVALRQCCTETGVTMIVLAQMSRAFDQRDGGSPKFSDLKESGQLEQDSDVLMFLVWPHKQDPEQPKENYQIWISKNRNRGINRFMVECTFDADRQQIRAADKFSDYDSGF